MSNDRKTNKCLKGPGYEYRSRRAGSKEGLRFLSKGIKRLLHQRERAQGGNPPGGRGKAMTTQPQPQPRIDANDPGIPLCSSGCQQFVEVSCTVQFGMCRLSYTKTSPLTPCLPAIRQRLAAADDLADTLAKCLSGNGQAIAVDLTRALNAYEKTKAG